MKYQIKQISLKEEIISAWNNQKVHSRRTFLPLPLKQYKSKDSNFLYNPAVISNLLNNWEKYSGYFDSNIKLQ